MRATTTLPLRSLGTLGTLLGGLLLGGGLAACGPDERDNGNGGTGDGGTGDGGGGGDSCSDASKLVYVVDENNQLLTFTPTTKTFSSLGTLSCPATPDPLFGTPATPFSMAIDRDANAWILYSSGELFKVNTSTLACTATSWQTQAGLALFGMGFSTEAAGGTSDTLFIAGSSDPGLTNATLARLDINSMQATTLGTVDGSPELTGTGSAELWGFFPGASGARVEKLNKANGMATQTYNLNTLAGEPAAWAFAFWGGDFWVFLMRSTETSTNVYQISGSTGMVLSTTAAPGKTIVGAGVSTCAPTVIL